LSNTINFDNNTILSHIILSKKSFIEADLDNFFNYFNKHNLDLNTYFILKDADISINFDDCTTEFNNVVSFTSTGTQHTEFFTVQNPNIFGAYEELPDNKTAVNLQGSVNNTSIDPTFLDRSNAVFEATLNNPINFNNNTVIAIIKNNAGDMVKPFALSLINSNTSEKEYWVWDNNGNKTAITSVEGIQYQTYNINEDKQIAIFTTSNLKRQSNINNLYYNNEDVQTNTNFGDRMYIYGNDSELFEFKIISKILTEREQYIVSQYYADIYNININSKIVLGDGILPDIEPKIGPFQPDRNWTSTFIAEYFYRSGSNPEALTTTNRLNNLPIGDSVVSNV
jgi:hypothetical protein